MAEKEKDLGAGAFKGICIKAFDGNNEIFFRELVNHSLRALETIPDETAPGRYDPQTHRCVRVVLNRTNKTLTFIHWGIGMTKDDLVDNLGTLGSKGVGFWSAFLVAEKVVVTTKHDDDEQYVWESQGGRSFKIARDTSGECLGRGTKITLFLKEDQLEYLDPHRMIDLVEKYFKYIDYKITIWVEKSTNKVMTKFVHFSRSHPKWSTWIERIPLDSVLESSDEEGDGGKKKNTEKQVSFEEKKRQFETLREVMEEILGRDGRKVQKVVISDNVVNNLPCYLSRDQESRGIIMEINSRDATMEQLREMADANKNDESLKEMIWLVYSIYYETLIWFPETFGNSTY